MPELTVKVDDKEFLEKTHKQQNLLIFRSLSCVQAAVERIDEEGCKMIKRQKKNGRRRIVLSVGGVGVGLAGLIELIKSLLS